jgi:hypothetical protein
VAIPAYLGRHDHGEAEAALAPASLRDVLQAGRVVTVRGYFSYWPRASRVDLQVDRVDPATSAGVVQERRGALLQMLRADGLTERQHAMATLPLAPLRVALVTGHGTTVGAPDVTDTLHASGFRVIQQLYEVSLEGPAAGEEIAAAIRRAERDGSQMILLVRGGGDSHQLLPFDSEAVAKAVAHATVPVITGIGHQHNQTVADEVAYQAGASPAAAAAVVVEQLRVAQRRLEEAARAARHLADQQRATARRRRWRPTVMAVLVAGGVGAVSALLLNRRLGLAAAALLAVVLLGWSRRRRLRTPLVTVPTSAASAVSFEEVLSALGEVKKALSAARTVYEVDRLAAASHQLAVQGFSLLGLAPPTDSHRG